MGRAPGRVFRMAKTSVTGNLSTMLGRADLFWLRGALPSSLWLLSQDRCSGAVQYRRYMRCNGRILRAGSGKITDGDRFI